MRVVTVLKTHLRAGWHNPSGGCGGRQTGDIYRAGEEQEREVRTDSPPTNSSVTQVCNYDGRLKSKQVKKKYQS